jgi:hypothetical protein
MSTNIRDLGDQQLLDSFKKYMAADTANWTIGLALLVEMSRRFKTGLDREIYMTGLRRIISIKPSLKGREEHFFPADFVIPLSEVKALIQAQTADVCLAAVENISVAPLAGTLRYEMPIMTDVAGFGARADLILGKRRGLFTQLEAGRLLAFGSCFAVNIGRTLREAGRSVFTLVIAEDVNSPHNNLQLLRRIFLGETNPISEELGVISGLDYAQLKKEFEGATNIIFTLGNIFHLELDGAPTLYAKNGAVIAEETIEQTVANLSEIFSLLKNGTNAQIIASVSPIPISGYRGDDFASAEEADCVSKSQLRAALHATLKQYPEVTYVPTFEIFRWLAAHQAFPTFGLDDGNARHIGQVLLSRVLDSVAG